LEAQRAVLLKPGLLARYRAWGDPIGGDHRSLDGNHYAKMVVAEAIDLTENYDRLFSRLKEYVEEKMKRELQAEKEGE
jgi:hypothetical protein